MDVNIHKEKKIICIWLPKSEADYEPSIFLRALFERYKQMHYSIVIFKSGMEDLKKLTGELLLHNRRRFAERELGISIR